ncbi:MAG: bifunctional nicotinamidase/pyrazinamidase [bacterium]|nr:bifunctional nicotinamidase/pyrazinamidase [bacterium]
MHALILVDLQNDFVPGGALAVPGGDEIVPLANRLQGCFELVVATQDWHPPGHASFAASHPGKSPGDVITVDGLEQTLWPTHCVQDTPGAALVGRLDTTRINRIIQKGTDPTLDSYSGFFDNGHRRPTGLGDYLRQRQVERIYVLGIATDYCVKFTVLDARKLGFDAYLIQDACRGVDLVKGDVARAVDEMTAADARVIRSENLLRKC